MHLNRAKFKPERFKDFPLHRAAACKSVAECSQLLADGVNPYQPTQKGWTALHAAIANRAERVVDLLLDRYEEDWTIAQQTIKHQFLWKTEQVEWKTRPILIAWTKEECEATVAFATSCPAGIPLSSQVFVLLRNPNHGHRFIALDVCNRSKWIDIMRLIRRLVSNGVLSLDRSDLKQHDALNYLQLACILSTKEIIVKLIGRGASLAVVSGSRGQNPFMAAGEAMRQDVIDLLMSKYSDRFDPFACDIYNNNVLHLVVQRQHVEMVKCLVNYFQNYRTTKLRESKSVALGRILHYESNESTSLTVWHFVRSPRMKQLCERYIQDCGIDLTTRLGDTTTLAALIAHGVALKYCFEHIEQNLALLELCDRDPALNILHILIRCKHLSFVETLYRQHGPRVKELFEAKVLEMEVPPAYELLRLLIHNSDTKGILFVLKYHQNFYVKDMAKLQKVTIFQHQVSNLSHLNVLEKIATAVPELSDGIEEVKQKATLRKNDFYANMQSLCESFNKTAAKLEANGSQLDDYLDSNRRTFLHAAVAWGHRTLVERLLSHNADVMKLDKTGMLPIHLTYRYDSMFRLLLERNEQEQLAYVNPAGYNLLHIGCKNGLHGDALERLIEHGMDVNGPAPDGQLPLSLAACCGTVKFLLAHGAHIELLNGELLAASLNHMHYCAAHRIILRVAQLPWFRECAHMYLPWMVTNRDISERNQDFLEEHPHIRRFLFDCLYEHSKEQMAQLFARAAHNGMLRIVLWILDYRYDIDYDYTHCDRSTPLLGLLDYHRYDIRGLFGAIEKLVKHPIDSN